MVSYTTHTKHLFTDTCVYPGLKYPAFPLSVSSGDIPDTPSVLASVGGGVEDVASCHLDGRGSQVPGPQLHRARKPDPGQKTCVAVLLSAWVFVSQSGLCLTLSFVDVHFSKSHWKRKRSYRGRRLARDWSVPWWRGCVSQWGACPGRLLWSLRR